MIPTIQQSLLGQEVSDDIDRWKHHDFGIQQCARVKRKDLDQYDERHGHECGGTCDPHFRLRKVLYCCEEGSCLQGTCAEETENVPEKAGDLWLVFPESGTMLHITQERAIRARDRPSSTPIGTRVRRGSASSPTRSSLRGARQR